MLEKEKPFLPKKQFLKNQFVDCEFAKESLNTLAWAWVNLWLLQRLNETFTLWEFPPISHGWSGKTTLA